MGVQLVVESRAEMGKMQVLGVVAVILAVYCVHATVYFREEFLDGGKFGLDILNVRFLVQEVNSLHVSLTVSHYVFYFIIFFNVVFFYSSHCEFLYITVFSSGNTFFFQTVIQ